MHQLLPAAESVEGKYRTVRLNLSGLKFNKDSFQALENEPCSTTTQSHPDNNSL